MIISKKVLTTVCAIGAVGAAAIAMYLWKKLKKDVCAEDNNEDESEKSNVDNIEIDIAVFTEYLHKNNFSESEVDSIIDTIKIIHDEFADKYDAVKIKMYELIDTEFDLNKILTFDEENYNAVYLSIEPCQLFIKNGFKILFMGPEHQEDMMKLSEVLTDLRDTSPNEVAVAIHDIYHAFKDMNFENNASDIYDKYFNKYVNLYVYKNNNTEEA